MSQKWDFISSMGRKVTYLHKISNICHILKIQSPFLNSTKNGLQISKMRKKSELIGQKSHFFYLNKLKTRIKALKAGTF